MTLEIAGGVGRLSNTRMENLQAANGGMDDGVQFSSTRHDPVLPQTTHPAPQEGESLSGPPPSHGYSDDGRHPDDEDHARQQFTLPNQTVK